MKAKIVLRKDRINDNKEQQLVIKLSHKGSRKLISTPIYISPKYWKDGLKSSHPDYPRLKYKLSNLQNLIDLAIYESTINAYSIEIIANFIKNDGKLTLGTNNFFEFAQGYLQNLTEGNKKIYLDTLRVIKTYQLDVKLTEITAFWARSFKEYLQNNYTYGQGKHLKPNTVRRHMRTFRSIYLKALEDRGEIGRFNKSNHPFLGIVPNKVPSTNKALKVDELKKIFSFNGYERGSRRWKALQLFKFHFLMRGLDTIDIALLKKDSLDNDNRVLIENRFKNRNRESSAIPMYIKLFPEALEIWNYFLNEESNTSVYTFDFMMNFESRRRNYLIELTRIKKDLNIEGAFSFKVTRYTFATIAASMGYSNKEVGQLLGHAQGSNVTEGYVEDLSIEQIDSYHEQVINIISD